MFTKDYSQDEIIDLLEKNKIGGDDIMPSLGQRLIAKGRDEGINLGMKRGRQEGIHLGIERGIERGIEKGIERGKLERDKILVKNMINQGVKIEDISKFTGLSKEKIEKIIKEQLKVKSSKFQEKQ